ncbi:hypothetical protein RRSWK_06140 [Rhodopirellula sp. SWK7]|nr:hypothetical protein RRSWK_06140 [Rhodopirellula sp. SWK7]
MWKFFGAAPLPLFLCIRNLHTSMGYVEFGNISKSIRMLKPSAIAAKFH